MKDVESSYLESGNPPPADAGIFGSVVGPDNAGIILIPVPWEATASYGRGTSHAPVKIVPVSHQLDVFDEFFGEPYRCGIAQIEPMPGLGEKNRELIDLIDESRSRNEVGIPESLKEKVNQHSRKINDWVEKTSKHWLDQGRIVGVLGGDHSCPLGLMRALSAKHGKYGVLHIDAHLDMREAYEGFTYSHASIMFNAMAEVKDIQTLVQLGMRDFSRGEWDHVKSLGERVKLHTDRSWAQAIQEFGLRKAIDALLSPLPQKVYVSFDIDGLDPALCPGTGTPVPGGLSFQQAVAIMESLALSGREIIGFDLCEVAGTAEGDWDLNVGARVLYKLCGLSKYKKSK